MSLYTPSITTFDFEWADLRYCRSLVHIRVAPVKTPSAAVMFWACRQYNCLGCCVLWTWHSVAKSLGEEALLAVHTDYIREQHSTCICSFFFNLFSRGDLHLHSVAAACPCTYAYMRACTGACHRTRVMSCFVLDALCARHSPGVAFVLTFGVYVSVLIVHMSTCAAMSP